MNEFMKAVRVLVITICIALFLVGIIWNLFYGTLPEDPVSQPTMGEIALDSKTREAQYTAEKMQAENSSQPGPEATDKQVTEEESTDQQAAVQEVTDGQTAETQGADVPTAEVGLFSLKQTTDTEQEETDTLADQLAALRMERDSSWQQLKEGLEDLQFAQKQECLKQYEELQYKEQRLELLLKAKGFAECLVLLEEQQANVIAGGSEVETQYQKIYDLVQRNTNYAPEQIVIVPLTAATSLAKE